MFFLLVWTDRLLPDNNSASPAIFLQVLLQNVHGMNSPVCTDGLTGNVPLCPQYQGRVFFGLV